MLIHRRLFPIQLPNDNDIGGYASLKKIANRNRCVCMHGVKDETRNQCRKLLCVGDRKKKQEETLQ